MLETIELDTGANPNAAILWLHGLGADGHDFEPVVPQRISGFIGSSGLCVTAPKAAVGPTMPEAAATPDSARPDAMKSRL